MEESDPRSVCSDFHEHRHTQDEPREVQTTVLLDGEGETGSMRDGDEDIDRQSVGEGQPHFF